MKSLYIFDRNHKKIDEIDTYNNDLQYGWTLNDIDTAAFSIGLENPKCTPENMMHRNHVEIWDGTKCIWGGQIAGLNFDDPTLKVNLIDYLSLLKWRRLRAKTYGPVDYGTLMAQIIADINAISDTGVSMGSIAPGALQTTRIVQNTDFAIDKIYEFNADVNYDFDVDMDRKFNFYLRKGSDKPKYTLEYGGQADNIIEKPTLAQDIMSMANSIYSETSDTCLSSLAQDSNSQALYGLMEGTYSANSGVSEQFTLDNQVNGALQRSAYPVNSFSIKAKDSSLCPFDDLIVGDTVTVHLIPYFDFKQVMRIIRMVHDENTGTRDITFGNIIFKPQKPVKKLYKDWR